LSREEAEEVVGDWTKKFGHNHRCFMIHLTSLDTISHCVLSFPAFLLFFFLTLILPSLVVTDMNYFKRAKSLE